jgi:acyl carrier protein
MSAYPVTDAVTRAESYCREREAVLKAVRGLLIDNLGLRRQPEEIDPDTALFGSGLGLDSIDAVEIVIALETEFGVKLTDERSRRGALRSVNAIVDAVMATGSHSGRGET